jgi:hypothetical protein
MDLLVRVDPHLQATVPVVRSVADPDPRHFGKPGLDPHQSEKSDPDPHQSYNSGAMKNQNGAMEGPG